MAKILLVDHNPQIRLLTKKLIETREGWRVQEAFDGTDAIVKLAQIKPDLLVLDFAMPGLNGFQIAEKVSSHFPQLPIILYTFYGFNVMNAEAKKHGITVVVDKTESGESLLQTIEKCIAGNANSQAGALELPDVSDKENPKQSVD